MLPTRPISHAYRVRALYKQAINVLRNNIRDRVEFRYQAVLMRAKFDENKNEVDIVKARKLVDDGFEEVKWQEVCKPLKKPRCPGGITFGRSAMAPDWIFDTWHPYEKAQYPEFFATREIRKMEYIERWEKKHGKFEDDLYA